MKSLARHFELARGGDDANVRSMEGLRGFAVFLVFLVHYATLAGPWIPVDTFTVRIADAMHTVGNSGVDLFFILSGYLIYSSLISKRQRFGSFMHRRIKRLYPTFTVVFLLYVLLSFIFRSESKIPTQGSDAFIYLIQNFLLLPGLFPITPMISVAWSLSYELFYYLVAPLAIALFSMRERTAAWRISLFSLVAILFVTYCAFISGPIQLVMFISGILLFETLSFGERVPKPSVYFAGTALFFGVTAILLPWGGAVGQISKVTILFCAFFVVCLACFRTPSGEFARWFCWTPLRWLGNMSYSYYLLHGLVLKAAFLALSGIFPISAFGSWFFWALLPVMFLVTLLPTAALFLLVEKPYSLSPPRAPRTSVLFPGEV